MCMQVVDEEVRKTEAAQLLADIIREKLGIAPIDPVSLMKFIQSDWLRVSMLAHHIHGGK